mmetsp:Transcript_73456/g.134411  ORF Transcript_73456/g.134411 Transcript_73456/m.134411 type:complete len:278 (-) Transcript_73456:235-1068(-)
MEHKEHRLIIVSSKLLLDVCLGVVQNHRLQINIPWSIDTMHIAKRSSNGKSCVGDRTKLLISVPHFLRLSVQARGVHITVIHTIFFTAGDTEFHLQKTVDLGHTLQVLLADGHVFLQGLFRKVKHVGGKQRLSMFLEVSFVGLQHTLKPRQPALLAVICVKDHRDTIELCNLTHVHGTSNSAGNGCSIICIVSSFAGNELTTTPGESDDDGTTVLLSSLHARVDGICTNNVRTWDRKLVLLCIVQQVHQCWTGHNTRLHRGRHLCESSRGSHGHVCD